MTQPDPARECEMVLLAQAEFDGELDAAQAAALAAHRAQCPVCLAAERELAQTRRLMREAPYEKLPDAARERLLKRVGAAPGAEPVRPARRDLWRRGWLSGGFGFGLGAACAAGLAFILMSPAAPVLSQEVVADHIRALQPGHLEDVVSTDRHTVKPWFDGRLDFAPPVKDLAAAGFPLRGGRLDYIGDHPAAALVYQRDQHVIDLFVWPQSGAAGLATAARQGYNVAYWTAGGMTFWAVSDVEPGQLRAFAEAFQSAP